MASILLHSAGISLLHLGLAHTPRVFDRSFPERILNLRRTAPQMRRSAKSGVARPVQSGGRPAAPPSLQRQLAQLVPAPQTLVQPDVPPILVPQKIPIPAVLMWSPENTPATTVAASPPREATAHVRPSFDVPNHELNPADLNISATAFATEAPSLPPSRTSPVVVRGPEPIQPVPEMASNALGPLAPARVISISDLQMQEGTIALPPVNETAPASSSGLPDPRHTKGTSEAGNGNTTGKQDARGAAQNPGDAQEQEAAASGPAQSAAKTGSPPEAGAGSNTGNEPAYDRIALPKDGKFGVVVVESSLADQYPETAGLSIKTLAYTVYVHAGLTKSWTLQYSLPRAAEAAAAGNATRPDAPWPYVIVRPHLAPDDSNADAIMVHGFVNAAGRFEQLAVVFPLEFAETKFLLNALQQWQFRPATQHGQPTAVEVLLIIPQQPE